MPNNTANSKMRQYLQLIIDNYNKDREIRMESSGGKNTIWIYDIIDSWWGISAEQVGKALAEFGGADVEIYLNSPGGDVFEGRAIQTRLKQYAGNTSLYIDGYAASAATTVALGADKRIIAEGAFFMIHNSWTIGFGEKKDLRKTADLLEQIDDAIGSDYAAITGEGRDIITQWMDDETWFNANKTVELGFAHETYSGDSSEQAKNRAAWNLSAYKNAPAALTEPPTPNNTIERPSREGFERYLDMIQIG